MVIEVVSHAPLNIFLPKRPPPKSPFKRVEQWLTFSRRWHLLDAKWQCPDRLTEQIVPILEGRKKPIFHPDSDCGDHVVVYNTRHIAMKGFDWTRRRWMFDVRFPKGKNFYQSHIIHQHQPTRIVSLCVYAGLCGRERRWHRRQLIERLHLFPDEDVPSEVLKNISSQLPPPMVVPRRMDEYSQEEIDEFPALFDFPDDYVQEYDGEFGLR